MNILPNKISSVPPSIQLLFNNEKLDIIKTLCLLCAATKKNSKHRTVSEILFYYSLVNFDLIKLFEVQNQSKYGISPSPNLYFRFQTKINSILLNMAHMKFINIHGDITKNLDATVIQLTITGKEFFDDLESVFFSNLLQEYISTLDKINFSNYNLKILKGLHK